MSVTALIMVSASHNLQVKADIRLLGHDQLIQLSGTILVIPLVPQDASETLLYKLLRYVPKAMVRYDLKFSDKNGQLTSFGLHT